MLVHCWVPLQSCDMQRTRVKYSQLVGKCYYFLKGTNVGIRCMLCQLHFTQYFCCCPTMNFCVVSSCLRTCLRWPESHIPREHYMTINLSPNLLTSANLATAAFCFLERQNFNTLYTNNLLIFYYAKLAVLVPLPFIGFSSFVSAILISTLEIQMTHNHFELQVIEAIKSSIFACEVLCAMYLH